MAAEGIVFIVEERYYSDDQMLTDVIHVASSEAKAEAWIKTYGEEEGAEEAWFAFYSVHIDGQDPAMDLGTRRIRFFDRQGRPLRAQPELVHERAAREAGDDAEID